MKSETSPPTNRPPVWERADWFVAGIAAAVSFAVYAWTAAPNVTLLDSGEFTVAAQHFGVPHPTGYPLWTLLTWLFQLLPLGNAAWEVNLFSGVCAAIAVGLCAALLSSIQIWCFQPALTGRLRLLPRFIALAFSLMFAFSESMWSQAVIAEVYALQALLIAVFLILCYSWARQPSRDGWLLGAFFLLALAFSNHHLALVLAPLPYLLVLLLRRRAFVDWLFAGLLTLLLGYLGFAILSGDQATLQTAMRFFYCVALAFGVFCWRRRLRIRWRLIAFLPVAIALGLLPYAYMPVASSTNPPMNWAYTRTPEGFFASINRSQYPGALSDLVLKSLGRLVGTRPDDAAAAFKPPGRPGIGRLEGLKLWTGFFWQQIMWAFTPLALIGYFASFLFVFRFALEKRVWIYLMHVAFLLSAFLLPLISAQEVSIDRSGWWTQMPYHTYTFLIFAVLSGLGLGLVFHFLTRRKAALFWLTPALLLLPLLTLSRSYAVSSQRDHWFGWMFGYDMLKDLPPNSVMIGGTDPGRFVPTYMIFGESPQSDAVKRQPFDRRDLFIITQNALGDPGYMNYLRDQYTDRRPESRNAFERWLGRDTIYPSQTLVLPTEEEISEAIRKAVAEDESEGLTADRNVLVFGTLLRWLWEHNADAHEFFVEESFPIRWTYDYAVPHGLIYRLNRTKLDKLPPEDVARDMAFWKDYKNRLLNDPNFKNDFDAQRSFSKLRFTIGNIYAHRKMTAEAEQAYREALELWPSNPDAIVALSRILWEHGDFDEVLRLYDVALSIDPNSFDLWRLRFLAEDRKTLQGEIQTLEQKLARQPLNADVVRTLIGLYDAVDATNKSVPLAQAALTNFPDDPEMLRALIAHWEGIGDLPATLEPARQLAVADPTNFQNYLLLSRAWFLHNKKPEFYEAAEKAATLGGDRIRTAFKDNPMFQAWTNDPEFQKLVTPTPLAPAR